jgi:RNA polymerase sigma factor (sigma-70 family)
MKTPVQDLETFSDNTLMLKVKDGQLNTLGLLFERYKKPLFGFFYGMNKDAALSEDLVQNVFFRILKYRYLFRGEEAGNFKTWMFHIARNVNNDHYRKNKMGKTESVEAWESKMGHEEGYDVLLSQDDELSMLAIALERLPQDKREIILLSKYQEKKYKEIGEILGCSEGAVKVKVFRALQELKVVYQQVEKHM